MNYVVLDMEWNQPGSADAAVLCSNGVCLKNEIIQIGAVKLDENKNICGKFERIVKPSVIKSMNRMVSKLTGITDETLKNGENFSDVIEELKQFCGNDFVFLIWGYDDIRILVNNIKYHGMDLSWLPAHYNIQMIFCAQNNLEKRQYSLSFATEFCKIQLSNELHDALNDAEYTALVCKTLDLENGIKLLGKASDAASSDKGSYLLTKRKFGNIRNKDEIWGNSFITRPACPICGGKMSFEKSVVCGNYRYNIKAKCAEHGEFVLVLRLSQTKEELWCVCQQIYLLNDKTAQMLEVKKAKKRRRRRRPSKNGVAKQKNAAKQQSE